MSEAAIPTSLARPPWVPPRKKRAIVLTELPPVPDRLVFRDEAEREAWLTPLKLRPDDKDPLAAIPPAEREAKILAVVRASGILAITAAAHLSDEGLREAVRIAPATFLAHYQFAHVGLARLGLGLLEDLLVAFDRAPTVIADCLRRIDSPRVLAKLEASHPILAAEWGARFPRTAARRLVPLVVTAPAKEAAAALKQVRKLFEAGLGSEVDAVARELGEDVLAELHDLLAPPPLPPKPPALPGFVELSSLPRPALRDGTPLEPEQVERLVQLLACLPLGAAREALAPVKAACDPARLGDTLRVLVDRWVQSDAPTKERWVLVGAGLLGDDVVVHRLAESIAEWADTGKHTRVAGGVDALAEVGSDAALAHLARFAEKSKAKALKKRAAEAIAAFREMHGLGEDELADRLAPDLGFDAQGRLALSYGPREFRVIFDELAKVTLMDGDKVLRSLPKTAPTDDAALADRARAIWALVKKESGAVVEAQLRRLERAMSRGRTWSRAQLDAYHLRHPLMQHFARRLLWGMHDGEGALVGAFRVAEDGTFADVEDAEVTLPEAGRFSVVHPLALRALGEDLVARWGVVFGDYRVVQPFPQLARETFELDPAERGSATLARFSGVTIEGSRFFGMKHRGWTFVDYDFGKAVSGRRFVVLDTEPGLGFLAMKPEDQVLGALSLDGGGTFDQLTPVEVSEVLRDVELLRR